MTAVEGPPAHPHTFYTSAAGGGGIWKTTDYGETWINLTDGEGLRRTAIGAPEVPSSDTSVVYAGTGSERIRARLDTTQSRWQTLKAEIEGPTTD